MVQGLVIKNTFLCVAVDEEALPPPSAGRRRALTDGAVDAGGKSGAVVELAPLGAASSTSAGTSESSDCASSASESTSGLAAALEAGGAQAAAAIEEVCGAARVLSFDALGCHVVQRALELASPQEARRIVAGLCGMMVAAARSPHANFVLQKAIHLSGVEAAACIAEELLGQGRAVALNVCGGAVVCRLLEHSAGEPQVAALTDEILACDVAGLCCHKTGHQVAISIVSNGLGAQRAAVAAALRGNLQRFARHRFASQVVEQALLQAAPCEGGGLARELMGVAGAVASLACHGFGVQVVRALLQVPGASEQALHYVLKSQHRLRKDRYGLELLRQLGADSPSRGA